MAFHCLMSAFKGVCHLPGDRGFSLLVTRELEPRRTDSVNKGTAAREAAAAAPAAVCGPLAGAPAGVAGSPSPGGGAGGCVLSRPDPPLLLGPGPLWVGAPWTEFRCISEREPDMESGAGMRGDEAPRLGSLSPASSPLVTQAACVSGPHTQTFSRVCKLRRPRHVFPAGRHRGADAWERWGRSGAARAQEEAVVLPGCRDRAQRSNCRARTRTLP